MNRLKYEIKEPDESQTVARSITLFLRLVLFGAAFVIVVFAAARVL